MRRWLRQQWRCLTHQCDYYQHYLAYGPAELTHIGYHAAERHCERAQRRLAEWLDTHPTGDVPAYLSREASRWEERVRA